MMIRLLVRESGISGRSRITSGSRSVLIDIHIYKPPTKLYIYIYIYIYIHSGSTRADRPAKRKREEPCHTGHKNNNK